MSIDSVLCRPVLCSVFHSIRVFFEESALCISWPKYWSFSFNSSPSNEHPGLISFRMDWLDLLAVQGTLKSLLLCCWKRVFVMTSAFSWQNSISLYPTSFCTWRPNLPVTPGVSWLPIVQFSSVAQSCPTLCDPMNCSTPGLPVHHQLPEFTQFL